MAYYENCDLLQT